MIDGGGLSAPASFPRADPLPVVLIVLLWWRGTVLRRWSWIGKQTVPLATGLAIPIDVVLMAENARL